MRSSVLDCIFCSHPISILSKQGCYLHCHCDNCGMDNAQAIMNAAQKELQDSDKQDVQIFERRRQRFDNELRL